MRRASGPERRTMPMPPRPGGVEMATIVSSLMGVEVILFRVTRRIFLRGGKGGFWGILAVRGWFFAVS